MWHPIQSQSHFYLFQLPTHVNQKARTTIGFSRQKQMKVIRVDCQGRINARAGRGRGVTSSLAALPLQKNVHIIPSDARNKMPPVNDPSRHCYSATIRKLLHRTSGEIHQHSPITPFDTFTAHAIDYNYNESKDTLCIQGHQAVNIPIPGLRQLSPLQR